MDNLYGEMLKFVFLLCVSIILPMLLIADAAIVYSCSQYELKTGMKTEVSHFNACFIEHNGEMVHWEIYKARKIAEYGLRNEN